MPDGHQQAAIWWAHARGSHHPDGRGGSHPSPAFTESAAVMGLSISVGKLYGGTGERWPQGEAGS